MTYIAWFSDFALYQYQTVSNMKASYCGYLFSLYVTVTYISWSTDIALALIASYFWVLIQFHTVSDLIFL